MPVPKPIQILNTPAIGLVATALPRVKPVIACYDLVQIKGQAEARFRAGSVKAQEKPLTYNASVALQMQAQRVKTATGLICS